MNAAWIARIAQILKWLAGFFAAMNYQRLATPDTAATAMDYGLYVGLPSVASAAAYGVEAFTRWLFVDGVGAAPSAGSQVAPRPMPSGDWLPGEVSKIVARLIADGRVADAKTFIGLLPGDKS